MPKKNYIIYIGGFELPDKNAAAQRVMANAKALEKIGYSIIFIGVDKSLSKDVPIQETVCNSMGYTIYNIPYPKGIKEWLFYLVSIKNYLKVINVIGKQSISHLVLYNFPSIPLWRLFRYAKKNNLKVLSDCTEWASTSKILSVRDLFKKWDTIIRMKYVHKKIDGLIAISKYLYDYYKPKLKNVQLIPPLVDLSNEKWNQEAISSTREGLKFIYAGSPGTGAKDRLDKIIEALAKVKKHTVKPFVLYVVGLTKEEYFENFKISELPENIHDHIFFMGRLSHYEVIKQIKEADFSIFFRNSNLINNAGFPTKFVESIACGTPVICNDTSNIQEFVKEYQFGKIVDFLSQKELTNNLLEIIHLKEPEIIKLKENCKKGFLVFDYNSYLNSFNEIMTSTF